MAGACCDVYVYVRLRVFILPDAGLWGPVTGIHSSVQFWVFYHRLIVLSVTIAVPGIGRKMSLEGGVH